MPDKSVIWTFKLLLFFNLETFDRHSCKQWAFEESGLQSNLPITIKSTKLIATFIYINQQLVSALAAKDDFPSTKGSMLIFIFIRNGLSILKTDNMKLPPQKHISFEPTTTYLLKDLKPFTTYTFRLAARSKHGVGAYTNEISAETPQTRRSSSLSDRV